MARALIYLTIFTLFAWSALVSITYALPPTHPNQELIPENVTGVAVALFIASSLTICLIISIAKSLLPNRKLPHLLIRDSLIYSSILGMGCTGLFMLQLLRSATLLNVGLWLAIIITTVWIIRSVRHTKAGDPTQANNYPMKRSPVLGKKLRRR